MRWQDTSAISVLKVLMSGSQ
jgi:hypothetical protein